jgi:peroxiredoxin
MLPEAIVSLRETLEWAETSASPQSDLIQGTIAADLEARGRPSFRFEILLTLADAGIEAGDVDLARTALGKMRQWLDTDYKKYFDQSPANFPDHEGTYFIRAARLAEAEGHKLDALAYYQQLIVNPWYTREYGGPVAKARALFKELGGSDESWTAWSKPQRLPSDEPEVPRGYPIAAWSALERPLPELRVPDVSGRTWTLADFKGKTTFLFLWATWCGPCWHELPAMQKLYDAVKGRSDVQAVSLSMDENPGIARQFMERRGLSFPVLVSKAYVEQVVPEVVLGQTWLIDPAARIRLQQQSPPFPEKVWVDEALFKLNHPPE